MLVQTEAIDVATRMYLVGVHEDRQDYECVQCTDLREIAVQVLLREYARLSHDALRPS